MRAFLRSIGVEEMDGVLTQFVSMIPALDAQRFDFIAAGMQIRPARCEQIAFGDPEWKSTQAFLTRSGNPSKLTSLDDVIANPGARLGVVGGGTEREYAAINGVPDTQIVIFPDLPTLKELNVDIVDGASFGLAGPKGLPAEVVTRMHGAVVKELSNPDTRKFVEEMGVVPVGSTPAEFATRLAEMTRQWAELGPKLGIEKQ